MPELEQEGGREGVFRVRRLLEATFRFWLPYNAYKHPERVTLTMLNGHTESCDLAGDYLDEEHDAVAPVFVEVKTVQGAAGQGAKFERFLAEAYSATVRRRQDTGHDPGWQFFWATTSPWIGEGHTKVAKVEKIRSAIETHRDALLPPDHQIEEALVRELEARLWLWVIPERQEEMLMGRRFRGWVKERLEQEER